MEKKNQFDVLLPFFTRFIAQSILFSFVEIVKIGHSHFSPESRKVTTHFIPI